MTMQRMPGGAALFGSSAAGPGSTGGNKHLIELRAGKMFMKGRTVIPDRRKGLLYVYQSEDSLMHFCWQDRTSGNIEDDLIIFPDDCEYVKVPQCTTGRVYLLKFKSSNRKFFFWLQEPSADKDDDNCKAINDYLNNPSGSVPSATRPDQDLQALLNNMSQSQLAQLFGGVGQMGGLHSLLGTISRPSTGSARTTTPAITHRTTPATTATPSQPSAASPAVSTPQTAPIPAVTPGAPKAAGKTSGQRSGETAAAAATPAGSGIQLADLQSFLQGFAPAPADQQSVDLSTALNAESLSGLLSNPEALEQLQDHLPPVDADAREALRTTLQSPQFQQAVSQFSSALESGQLGPVVSQLSVNPEAVAAATHGDMQEFVKALEKTSSDVSQASGGKSDEKEKPKDDKKDKKKGNDDEEMQLD